MGDFNIDLLKVNGLSNNFLNFMFLIFVLHHDKKTDKNNTNNSYFDR